MKFLRWLIVAAAVLPVFAQDPAYVISSVSGLDSYAGASRDNIPASEARIQPSSLAVDDAGNFYFIDGYPVELPDGSARLTRLRKIDASGTVSTLADSVQMLAVSRDGAVYFARSVTSTAAIYRLEADGSETLLITVAGGIRGLAADPSGNLYYSIYSQNRVIRVDAAGNASIFAGTGESQKSSGDGGPADRAAVPSPGALLVDRAGNLYISSYWWEVCGNWRVCSYTALRKVSPGGVISTVLSGPQGQPLTRPQQMAVDSHGVFYFLETAVVRWDGSSPQWLGSSVCTGLAIDAADRLILADYSSISVDGVRLAGRTGSPADVDVRSAALFSPLPSSILALLPGGDLAAGPFAVSSDGRIAALWPSLNQPNFFAVDESGYAYETVFAEGSFKLRRIAPSGEATLGPGSLDRWPGARPVAARNGAVYAIYLDSIIRIDADGAVTVVAGRFPANGFSGDNGPATDATLRAPAALAFDAQGNLYIADTGNLRIRKVDPGGTITTVAGSPLVLDGYQPIWFCGDGGPATSACLHEPRGIAVGGDGALYIADSANHRVRAVGPDGVIRTIAGRGDCQLAGGDGGPAQDACLLWPVSLQLGGGGQVFVGTSAGNRVRKLAPPAGPAPQIFPAYVAPPSEALTIAGANLALIESAAAPDRVAYRLAGTAVTVTDSMGVELPAMLLAAAPDRVTFVIPSDLKPGGATIKVIVDDGRAAVAPLVIIPR